MLSKKNWKSTNSPKFNAKSERDLKQQTESYRVWWGPWQKRAREKSKIYDSAGPACHTGSGQLLLSGAGIELTWLVRGWLDNERKKKEDARNEFQRPLFVLWGPTSASHLKHSFFCHTLSRISRLQTADSREGMTSKICEAEVGTLYYCIAVLNG